MKRIFLVLLLLGVGVLLYYGIGAGIDYQRNVQLLAPGEGSLHGLYDLYLRQNIILRDRAFLGEESAPVTITAIVDFTSESNREYYNEIIPLLEKHYVETGQAKLYHKHYVTREEYVEKRGRFKYARAVACYSEAGGAEPIAFHQALFAVTEEEIPGLAQEFGLGEDFTSCLESVPSTVYEDMLETRLFRIRSPSLHVGLNEQEYTILTGRQSMAQINQTIRSKQVTLGI